jgi:hypothetical protein
LSLAVEARAEEAGVALSAADVEAEIARQRQEFLRQPGIEGTGVSFEDWLRDRLGLTLEELRRDGGFRANLLARRIAGAGIAPEAVRREWEGNPGRYGESARVRRIVVHGEERAGVFGSSARPMAEARAIADRALEEVRSGRPFDAVARKYSEDAPAEEARGQPMEFTTAPGATVLPQPVLEAVFRAKEGEVLGPLKAVDGWYLVLVERRTPAPTFEQAAPRVREDLVAAAVREWRLALRNDPEVKVADDL